MKTLPIDETEREVHWNAHMYSIRYRIVLVCLIYGLNILMAMLSLAAIENLISSTFSTAAMPSHSWLDFRIQLATFGLILGELGCAALWFNLSTMRMVNRAAIYLFIVLQLIFLLALISAESFDFGLISIELLVSFGTACGLLLLTAVALYFSHGKIRLSKLTDSTTGKSFRGFTLAQGFIATTSLAIALASVSAIGRSSSPTFFLVLIIVTCVAGLLPTAGLIIGSSLNRVIVQLVVGLVFASAIVLIIDPDSRRAWVNFVDDCIPVFVIIAAPILWLRILQKFGYFIERVDTQPQEVTSERATSIFDDGGQIAQL